VRGNQPGGMTFLKCTDSTTCGVRRQKEVSQERSTEAQKIAEAQKTPEKATAGKSSEKGKAEAPVKKNVTILKRPAQPEISPDNLPSTSDRKEIDQPEPTTQARTLAPFCLEAELAKIKIPVPLTELISRGGYRSQVLKALAIKPDIDTQALAVRSGNSLRFREPR
jgi:hypothetical protein